MASDEPPSGSPGAGCRTPAYRSAGDMLAAGELPLAEAGPAPQLLTSPAQRTEQLQTAALPGVTPGPRRSS
jgi:hypothetical protein